MHPEKKGGEPQRGNGGSKRQLFWNQTDNKKPKTRGGGKEPVYHELMVRVFESGGNMFIWKGSWKEEDRSKKHPGREREKMQDALKKKESNSIHLGVWEEESVGQVKKKGKKGKRGTDRFFLGVGAWQRKRNTTR